MNTISYADIPPSSTKAGTKTIYYRRRTGNKDKYVYLHEEDRDYIIHWCNRLVCDVAAKQVVDPFLFEELYKSRKSMPKSGYSTKRNSIMTYCSGIVSNVLRNPTEDLAFNQLEYLQNAFLLINFVYTQGPLSTELGYTHIHNIPNKPPSKILFREA